MKFSLFHLSDNRFDIFQRCSRFFQQSIQVEDGDDDGLFYSIKMPKTAELSARLGG